MTLLAAVLAANAAVAPPPAAASAPAKKALTLEAVSEARMPSPYAWRDATHVVWSETENGRAALWQADAASGAKAKLLDAPSVKDASGAEKPLPFRGAVWSDAGDAYVVAFDHDLWLDSLPKGEARRLTSGPEDESQPAFSPDGRRLAFVRANDLFVLDLSSGTETRLTTTGSPTVLNGVLDWVYGEELAQRRGARAYVWAPDSSAIAYLALDDTKVPTYPIVDFAPTSGKVEAQRYPKAGDPNPVPSVHVVDLAGKETASWAPSGDGYVAPELSWTRDSKNVCFLPLDRAQTHLSVQLLPRAGGAPRTLLEESDPAWINAIAPPHFLADGSFVFLSERTGFFHLYRFGPDGALKNAITKGAWMVDGGWAVDEKAGRVLFRASTEDPRERQVFAATLDGRTVTPVTKEAGVHGFTPSPGAAFFVDTYSSVTAPPRVVVRSASGAVAVAIDGKPNALLAYELGSVELGSFTGADRTTFYTRLTKPAGFDPAKKYPVVVYVYGGPHTQLVQNAWPPAFDRYLASKGFLVFTMDGRGSWGRGHAFETPILRNMGAVELKDQLEGVAELKKLPYVDAGRLGIWGWSYGGYMTLYAATHSGATFKAAAAGAPVADWTLYDSIYTERYMKTPKENPEGYRTSSPLLAAKDLSPKLLVLHGTSDDNVHMQNSIRFFGELVKAKKDFTFVPLPGQTHGPRGDFLVYRNQRLAEFFVETLAP